MSSVTRMNGVATDISKLMRPVELQLMSVVCKWPDQTTGPNRTRAGVDKGGFFAGFSGCEVDGRRRGGPVDPRGIKASSRWLSGATPPESDATRSSSTPEGCQRRQDTPCRGTTTGPVGILASLACLPGSRPLDPVTGGVAPINYRRPAEMAPASDGNSPPLTRLNLLKERIEGQVMGGGRAKGAD